MLNTALKLADKGHFVFPLRENDKRPAIKNWEGKASRDPNVIERWWKNQPNRNIGIATGPSGLLVVDVDKRSGGLENYDELEIEHGITNTKMVSTPSGGFHLYFKTDKKFGISVDKLVKGVDTRANGGYVVAEGSCINHKEYQCYNDNDTIAPLPAWIEQRMTPRTTSPTLIPESLTPDSTVDVEVARTHLLEAHPAIQGEGGDQATFNLACWLNDRGISEDTGVELLIEHWNDRCEPPWEEEELRTKMRNAYEFSQGSFGSKSMEDVFDEIVEEEDDDTVHCVADIPDDVPQRDWLIEGRLISGFVTVTVAAGGVGKSMYTMLEALCVATGKELTGKNVMKKGAVLIYNTEDPVEEIQRRFIGLCSAYNTPKNTLDNMYYMSGVESPLKLVVMQEGKPTITKDRERLKRIIEKYDIKMIVVDPFLRSHSVDENSNNAIDMVAQQFSTLALETGVAVSVVHHSRKIGTGGGNAGNMDITRGASSLASAARVVSTLLPMTEEEAEEMGVTEYERLFRVRLDSAKGNMSSPGDKGEWFRKESVEIDNGDSIGVLRRMSPFGEDVFDIIEEDEDAHIVLKAVGDYMGTGFIPTKEVIDDLDMIAPDIFRGKAFEAKQEVFLRMFGREVQGEDYKMKATIDETTIKGATPWT